MILPPFAALGSLISHTPRPEYVAAALGRYRPCESSRELRRSGFKIGSSRVLGLKVQGLGRFLGSTRLPFFTCMVPFFNRILGKKGTLWVLPPLSTSWIIFII